MRGDSLRDFYAKTLAVLGLGVLAGAGAIVDYWPVSQDVPDVPAVVGLKSEAPVLVQNLNQQIPPPREAPREPAAMTVATASFNGMPEAAAMALDPMPAPEDFLRLDGDFTMLLPMESLDIAPAPVAATGSDDGHRMFTDAVRRTRESLAAAKLFLNDAFSGVVGAFRRVSPFFSTSIVGPSPY